MAKGETLGLVGETGCGKSVTALSILRLIPSPPGRVEEGEALFDVDDAQLVKLESLKSDVRRDFTTLFGRDSRYLKSALSAPLVAEASDAVKASSIQESQKQAVLPRLKELHDLLERYDLLSKTPDELRRIRGHQISMIFQEPMQALNPVFTIGDQISESVILHRRRWLSRRIVLRMREEAVRKHVVHRLKDAFRDRSGLPPGVDLNRPARSDFVHILDVLEERGPGEEAFVEQLRELIRVEGLLGMEHAGRSIYSRGLPRAGQFRTYTHECLRSGWRGADVLEELEMTFALQGKGEGEVPWAAATLVGDDAVALEPPAGLTVDSLLRAVTEAIKAGSLSEFTWSPLAEVLEPPEAKGGRLTLRVKKVFVQAHRPLQERLVARVHYLGKRHLIAQRLPARDEAAENLRLHKIPNPQREVDSYPHELRGGMNQRALIAIALSCNPLLLIADEPTTALDVTIQAQILELLKLLKQGGRPSILIITHDLGVIADICDRVCVMYGGVVVEDAPVREIFKDPKHPYTKGLLRAIPSHAQKKEALDTIPGSVPNLIYPPGGCRFHPRCPQAMPTCGWDAKDLEEALKAEVARLRIDAAVTVYERPEVNRLEVSFAEGEEGGRALTQVRAFIEARRSDSVLFQAVSEATVRNNVLVLSLLEPRKPMAVETSPGHWVACLLYEPESEAA